MSVPTEALRDEHRELTAGIANLRRVGDLVGAVEHEELKQEVAAIRAFVDHTLIPHATAEDRALYPVIDRLLGGQPVTASMSRDHVEIGWLAEELASIARDLAPGDVPRGRLSDLRRILYSLHAIVQLHFAEEEEIYLPILDQRLSRREVDEIVEGMRHAGHAAKAAT